MTKLLIKNAKVLKNDNFENIDVICENGKIKFENEINESDYFVIDGSGNYLLPGFIDIHTHGAVGYDVNSSNSDDLNEIGKYFASQGTTSWCASVLTDTEEKTIWCIEEIKKAMKLSGGANLLGVHLEGPFLSVDYKGSMPESLLRTADVELFNKYNEIADGSIKYMTISPELEGALDLIEEISGDVVISLGHSAADYETTMKAIKNGATCITHIFNAMRLFHQHEPAIMGAALESDAYCEAICDGLHLHPGSLRMLLKAKGWDRVMAVTDSIMATGLPDGEYKLGVNDVVVKNGDARLKNADVRAGSTLTTNKALKNIIDFTDTNLIKASKLMSQNPANAIKIFDKKGSIEEGKDADLVLLNEDLDVVKTIVLGEVVYEK